MFCHIHWYAVHQKPRTLRIRLQAQLLQRLTIPKRNDYPVPSYLPPTIELRQFSCGSGKQGLKSISNRAYPPSRSGLQLAASSLF